MSPPLFWAQTVPEPGTDAVLSGPEGRHAVTVTRVAVGERIVIGDGAGSTAVCEVQAVESKDTLIARVREFAYVAPPDPQVTVVQALPKSERSELAVDLATEAGADVIVPWQAARCVARWAGKADKGVAKWRAAASSAAKQSRRAWIPEITDLATTTDVRALCADTIATGGLRELPLAQANRIVLVIGPEGGLDDGEVADLTALGAEPVLLGPEILRTSTAAAVALGAIGVLTERWSR